MRKKINKKHRINENEPMILIDDQSTENVSYVDTKKYNTINDRLYRLRQIRRTIDELIDEMECEREQELTDEMKDKRIRDLINDLI